MHVLGKWQDFEMTCLLLSKCLAIYSWLRSLNCEAIRIDAESVAKREKKRKTVIDRGIDRLRGRRFFILGKIILRDSTTNMNGFLFNNFTVKNVS